MRIRVISWNNFFNQMLFICKITELLKAALRVFMKMSHVEKGKPRQRFKYLFYQDHSLIYSFNIYLLSTYYMSVPVLQQKQEQVPNALSGQFSHRISISSFLEFSCLSNRLFMVFKSVFFTSCSKRFFSGLDLICFPLSTR